MNNNMNYKVIILNRLDSFSLALDNCFNNCINSFQMDLFFFILKKECIHDTVL